MKRQISPEFRRELESEIRRLEQKPDRMLIEAAKDVTNAKNLAAQASTRVQVASRVLEGNNLRRAQQARKHLKDAMDVLVSLESGLLFETTGRSYR